MKQGRNVGQKAVQARISWPQVRQLRYCGMYDIFSVTAQLLRIYVLCQGLGSFVFVQGYWSLICLQSTEYSASSSKVIHGEVVLHILSRFYRLYSSITPIRGGISNQTSATSSFLVIFNNLLWGNLRRKSNTASASL